MIRMSHPKLGEAEFTAVNDDQASALEANGWQRVPEGDSSPDQTSAPQKRTAAKATTPKAAAAKNKE